MTAITNTGINAKDRQILDMIGLVCLGIGTEASQFTGLPWYVGFGVGIVAAVGTQILSWLKSN